MLQKEIRNPYLYVLNLAVRLMLLFTILLLPLCRLRAQSTAALTPHTTLIFFADRNVKDTLWPVLFAALHEELTTQNGDPAMATLDPETEFLRGDQLTPGLQIQNPVIIRLQGRCDVLPQTYLPMATGPLGWVRETHGVIQPFIFVDCERVAAILHSRAAGLSREQRIDLMSLAISHITLHEWVHIARQSSMHGSIGISQAQLSINELISKPGAPLAKNTHWW